MQPKFDNTHALSIECIFQPEIEKEFKIPPFQRDYSWDSDKVTTLMNDLLESSEKSMSDENAAQYLLGATVLVPDEDTSIRLVVDGQQRFATLTLLFCSMMDLYNEIEEIKYPITRETDENYLKILQMIGNYEYKDGKYNRKSWKLTLNKNDEEFFKLFQESTDKENALYNYKRRIKSLEEYKNKKGSHKLLINAYKTIYNFILDWLVEKNGGFASNHKLTFELKINVVKNDKTSLAELKKFFKNTLGKIFLIVIDGLHNTRATLTESDAFQIFETLNYRGTSLSKSNLIKSLILSSISQRKFDPQKHEEYLDNDTKFEETKNSVQNEWDEIFTETTKEQTDDKFLIESIKSRPPFGSQNIDKNRTTQVSKNTIYDIIKYRIKKSNQYESSNALEFVKELKNDSDFAQKLNDPRNKSTGYYIPKNKTSKNREELVFLEGIKELEAEYVRIPIMTAYRKYKIKIESGDKSEEYKKFKLLVVFLERFFFRYKTIRGKPPQQLEKMILKITEMVHNDENIESIFKYLLLEDDKDDFQTHLKEYFFNADNNPRATYILKKILYKKHPKKISEDDLSLEHIYPKKNKKWKSDFELRNYPNKNKSEQESYIDKLDKCLYYLGNMVLLNFEMNREIQNSPFERKKEKYRESWNPIIGKEVLKEFNSKDEDLTEWTPEYIEKRTNHMYEDAKDLWKLPTIKCSKCACDEDTIKVALSNTEISEIKKIKCPECNEELKLTQDWHGLKL